MCVGIEIETCVLFPDYEGLTARFASFRSDTDGSIRCPTDMGQMRRSSTSWTPQWTSTRPTSHSPRRTRRRSKRCASSSRRPASAPMPMPRMRRTNVSSCGTPTFHVGTDHGRRKPLLFHPPAALVNRWAATPRMGTRQRAAVEIAYLAKHSLPPVLELCHAQPRWKPLVKLNKYEALNLKFLRRYPAEYHVDFRSAGDCTPTLAIRVRAKNAARSPSTCRDAAPSCRTPSTPRPTPVRSRGSTSSISLGSD